MAPRPLQRFGLRADARATGDGRGLPALPGHGRVAVPGGRAPLPAQTSRRGGTADRDGPGATVYSRDGLDRTADLPLPAVLERRVSPVRAADAHPRYRAPQRHPVRAQAGNQAPPAEQAAPLCRAGGPAHGGGDPRAHHRRRRRLPPGVRPGVRGLSRRTPGVLQRHGPGGTSPGAGPLLRRGRRGGGERFPGPEGGRTGLRRPVTGLAGAAHGPAAALCGERRPGKPAAAVTTAPGGHRAGRLRLRAAERVQQPAARPGRARCLGRPPARWRRPSTTSG